MTTRSHTSRRLTGLLLAPLTLAVLAATALAAPAFATPDSPEQIFLETDLTGIPANAVTQGLWGHEGVAGDKPTFFSLDATGPGGTVSDQSLADDLAKIGPDATVDNIRVAFVLTSADRAAEQPSVTASEDAGDAFTWFGGAGFGTSLHGGTTDTDYVTTLSTQTSYDAWFAAGQHAQTYDNNLVAHDGDLPGNPVSTAPLGKSILNTWPAGTNVSMVYYVSDGNNAENEPTVKRGPGGKAETAWMTFTTVGSNNSSQSSHYNSIRTSAGYHVAGVVITPKVDISWTASKLQATIADTNDTPLPGATGTAQLNTVSGATLTPVGSPVTVSNAVASFPLAGLVAGTTYEVTYAPDGAASTSFTSATSTPYTGTSVAVAVTGKLTAGQKQSLKATVSPAIAGTVTFLDGSKKIGTANISGSGSGTATISLAGGSRSITAQFTPAPANYLPAVSSAAKVTIAKAKVKVAAKVSPKKVKHGQKPKLTITVGAGTLKGTGKVKVTYQAPHAKAKTITVKLKKGKATVTLPPAVKGKTSVSVTYAGDGSLKSGKTTLTIKAT